MTGTLAVKPDHPGKPRVLSLGEPSHANPKFLEDFHSKFDVHVRALGLNWTPFVPSSTPKLTSGTIDA